MGKQMTEMLKGTLEGIVLAILSMQAAYGYEITARLREQGFTDIAEGTVYALLVRIEQRGLVVAAHQEVVRAGIVTEVPLHDTLLLEQGIGR